MKDTNKNGVPDMLEFKVLGGAGIFIIIVSSIALFIRILDPWAAITAWGIGSTLLGGEGIIQNIKKR